MINTGRSDFTLANLQNGLVYCPLFQKINNPHSCSVIKIKVLLKYAPGNRAVVLNFLLNLRLPYRTIIVVPSSGSGCTT